MNARGKYEKLKICFLVSFYVRREKKLAYLLASLGSAKRAAGRKIN